MTDPTAMIGYVLDSPWLLPLLTLAVICDGPLPFLPSEPVLFSATATALADGDRWRIAALFGAALLGSLLGDGLLYGAGRSSNAVVRRPRRDDGIGAWVHRHLHRRPVVALVATRLLPGGRLASVSAAGRVRLPLRAFLPATVASSVVWSTWMTGIGVLVGPFTRGDPLLSVLAGFVLATIVAATAGLARRIVRARRLATVR
ncbi:DedA protein [Pseudonocardia sp. Ae168_Ps1]|uniref:DedA family protein n=1 Tax=unclassified Pseudonocardia TaxID=2619320 RepID=UPI0001FFDFE1|nr:MULTISPECIES: VTT domain-containing protein [unclassified Pseudonocardia]OLL73756.1 DedA protein [Pseudonocardia sp. Ae150A_Ps1]OLL79735.1 DedA protein [Pseudonocardia sp. Ae168_Ps1]OLL86129.1 DedA protein [Pseudonocardia sp. Ae263_Ps1]OLL93840.1 DedA protein [Pseudonocardia sp. Ae356_Ps1]OLM20348.1 DedA protein [Pseudonocardia sp. Ae707_Ps1]